MSFEREFHQRIVQRCFRQPIRTIFLYIPDDPVRLKFERRQEVSLLMLEGLYGDFPDFVDCGDLGGDVVPAELSGQNLQPTDCDPIEKDIGSEGEKQSFHGDNSNIDSTDDEVVTVVHDSNVQTRPVPDSTTLELFDDDASISDVSVYGGSDDERMAANSTDDDEVNYPVFNEATDMADPQFELGLLFSCSATFREAVKKYSLVNRRAIKKVKTGGARAKYICSGEGCKWKIYALPMQNSCTYQVMQYYSKHTCKATFKNHLITSTWIAKHYENDIRMNPTWPLQSFRKKVISDWKCEVSVYTIGRAKRAALGNINGKHAEQYGLLCAYAIEVRKAMPESTVELILDEPEAGLTRRRFKRIYICLGPIKRGFRNGCRPIIGLDGCHLKGPFGGQLLAAVGTDGNDGMYPIAWAVVEAENSETWNWFLQLLSEDVEIENSNGWTFISDKQKGLINALENVVPNAEHRFCVMHMYRNMWKEHKGLALRKCLWLAARATTEYQFTKHMDEMKKLSKKCYDWVMAKPKTQWTRSAFRECCLSDMFVNNHCEVFNSSIRSVRDLPVVKMLQCIHISIMKRIQQRRDKMLKSDALNCICPNAMRKINKAISFSGGCDVDWSGDDNYVVTMTDGGYQICVDLGKKICACRKYQLTGLPCYHAAACIDYRDLDMPKHIHLAYSKDMFLECYKHTVIPINSEEFWDKQDLPQPLPPAVKIAPGRPKKKRNTTRDIPKQATVLRRKYTSGKCSHCAVYGHNSRTCRAKNSTSGAAQNSNVGPPENSNATAMKPTAALGNANADNSNARAANMLPGVANKKMTRQKKKQSQSGDNTPSSAVTDEAIARLNSTTIYNARSQAGVFGTYSENIFVTNTAMGVQPTRFTATSSTHLTTLKQLQAAKNARKPPPKPQWKL